ncbi:NAD(P)-dependent oxidoreductase [Acidovorax sp. Leaf78]|uniref:NAD(P)-dependent oxidoreductase n=1 Tax=Acidovorax sp. Leaf78 TaxID=1736237 RepID=UPI0006F934CF|nr:NAD(P)-dependent oxidoreductase [Acidovorax sp. Leaf78]KQO23785.1 3-beta hydroxysteroid dehydrogenase [Acidovorax sp. Leaf78]
MNIALIGATGFVGSALLDELLQRGHRVTVLARNPGKLTARERLTVVAADAQDAAQIAQAAAGHDAVVSAYNPGWTVPDIHDQFLKGTRAIIDGTKQAGVRRLLVVGGAGSLFVAPGVQLVDTPEFPAEWKQGALAAREALNWIRTENTLDWTFLSPPILLAPGERTGKYRLGTEAPLMNGDAPGGISVTDLAVAIADELETPRHVQQRFTVAH